MMIPVAVLISTSTNSKPMQLPSDFEPRSIDILCGRGRGIWEHEGNQRFVALIRAHAEKYTISRTKLDKGAVIASLVDSIRDKGILFVKKDTKAQCWVDIGEYKAREKTSHAMRDFISRNSSSSSSSSVGPKKAQQQQQQSTSHVKEAQRKQTRRNLNTMQQPTVSTSEEQQQQQQQPYPNVIVSSIQTPVIPNKVHDDTVCRRVSNEESVVVPDIFQRLGLDYLSMNFQDQDDDDDTQPAMHPTEVPSVDSLLTSTTTFVSLKEEENDDEEWLEWSNLFSMEELDEFPILTTAYAYSA